MDIIKIESLWHWGTSIHLVTDDGHGLIKLCLDDNSPEDCDLCDLGVHPKSRRKGYARALMQAAESIAKERGCRFLLLWAKKKSWVRRWYERLGFYEEEFIEPPHPTTIVLRKNLKPVKYEKR